VTAARAALAEAAGDLEAALAGSTEAGELWGSRGCAPEHAHALHARARCLRALGSAEEAGAIAAEADAAFVRLGISPVGPV
jgi:hypothetical protein